MDGYCLVEHDTQPFSTLVGFRHPFSDIKSMSNVSQLLPDGYLAAPICVVLILTDKSRRTIAWTHSFPADVFTDPLPPLSTDYIYRMVNDSAISRYGQCLLMTF